jgi:hypothetical protein
LTRLRTAKDWNGLIALWGEYQAFFDAVHRRLAPVGTCRRGQVELARAGNRGHFADPTKPLVTPRTEAPAESGTTPVTHEPTEQPYSVDALRQAFNLTEGAGPGRRCARVRHGTRHGRDSGRQGGTPGDGALRQELSPEELLEIRRRVLATQTVSASTDAWMADRDHKAVKRRVIDTLGGERTVTNGEVNKPITIAPAGIKNALSHGIGPQKVAAVFVLPALLERAAFVYRDTNHLRPGIKAVETYACRLTVDGRRFVARLVVNHVDGRRFYDHELSRTAAGGREARR